MAKIIITSIHMQTDAEVWEDTIGQRGVTAILVT